MMKRLLLGVLLGLLVAYPALGGAVLGLVATIAAAVLAKPALVAFGLGLAAGLRAPALRRWAR